MAKKADNKRREPPKGAEVSLVPGLPDAEPALAALPEVSEQKYPTRHLALARATGKPVGEIKALGIKERTQLITDNRANFDLAIKEILGTNLWDSQPEERWTEFAQEFLDGKHPCKEISSKDLERFAKEIGADVAALGLKPGDDVATLAKRVISGEYKRGKNGKR